MFACKRVVDEKEFSMYGFAAGQSTEDGVIKMEKVIEKPGKENAPSELASVSTYLLPGKLLEYIEKGSVAHSEGEFTFQPFVQTMIDEGHSFYAKEIKDAEFYDTGNPLEYLKTTLDFGLRHPEFGGPLADYLRTRL